MDIRNDIEPLTIEEFKNKISAGCLVIDSRPVEKFLSGFIPGAVYLALDLNFRARLQELLSGKKIVLADEVRGNDRNFWNGQFTKMQGFLEGGLETWIAAGEPLDMIIDIDPYEFALDLPFDDKLLVLDVRTKEEYANTHVTGAIHMPLEQFADLSNLARFEEDWNIYIYGSEDAGSVTAISLMQRQGFYNVRNVSGGFKSILKHDNIPIETGEAPEGI